MWVCRSRGSNQDDRGRKKHRGLVRKLLGSHFRNDEAPLFRRIGRRLLLSAPGILTCPRPGRLCSHRTAGLPFLLPHANELLLAQCVPEATEDLQMP